MKLLSKHRIFTTSFASVYRLYVQKAEAKGRNRQEVDQVICWLTGYSPKALADQIERKKDFETFFSEAPALHPNASKISGVWFNRWSSAPVGHSAPWFCAARRRAPQ